MIIADEKRVIELLTEGVKVRLLQPSMFHEKSVFYRIHFLKAKMYLIIKTQKKALEENGKKINFEISNVYVLDGRIKQKITASSLDGKKIVFKPAQNPPYRGKIFSLTGTITLLT